MEYNIQTAALTDSLREMCRESGQYLDHAGRNYFVASDPLGMTAWVYRVSFSESNVHDFSIEVTFNVVETFTGETSVQDATRYCMDVDGVLV